MQNKILIFTSALFFSVCLHAKNENTQKFEKSVKKYLPEIQACRGDANTKTFMVSGKVVVDLEINDGAQISRIKINDEQTTLKDLNLQKCVIDVFKTIKFPKAAKGKTATISYPIIFK